MKKGLVIADSGPIFSLVLVDKLSILDQIFSQIKIPNAVWEEITRDESKPFVGKIKQYFNGKVQNINGINELNFVMDFGESESVLLYQETNADFLLIDDRKARLIAENLGINCIGTLGLLSVAKDRGIINELRPIFASFLENNRYYSMILINRILDEKGEKKINY